MLTNVYRLLYLIILKYATTKYVIKCYCRNQNMNGTGQHLKTVLNIKTQYTYLLIHTNNSAKNSLLIIIMRTSHFIWNSLTSIAIFLYKFLGRSLSEFPVFNTQYKIVIPLYFSNLNFRNKYSK